MPGTTSPHRAGWAAAILLTALAQAATLSRPVLDTDEATYASIAALMNEGGRLYAEGGVDNKPPGIYWTYAAVFAVFGRYAMLELHALKVLVVVATALVVAAVARRAGARGMGFAAFGLYGTFTAVHYPKMLAANTEVFMMLPLCASVLVLLRPGQDAGLARSATRMFAAGALIACACLYKQVAAVNVALLVLVALDVGRDDRRQAARMLVGALLGFSSVLAALAVIFAAQGTLDELWRWSVVKVLFRYGPVIVAQGLEMPLLRMASSLPRFVAFSALLWLLAAAALSRGRRLSRIERGLFVWCALSGVAAFAGGRFFGHYYIQLIGPLAVLGALELRRLLDDPATRGRRALGALAVVLVVGPAAHALWDTLRYEPVTDRYGAPDPDWRPVVEHVRASTAPDDRIFVWGMCAPLYLLSDRLPATRFVGFLRGFPRDAGLPMDGSWDAGPEVWSLLARDLREHPPRLILDTSSADYHGFGAYPMARVPPLRALLSDYELEATVAGVDVYRRRGAERAGRRARVGGRRESVPPLMASEPLAAAGSSDAESPRPAHGILSSRSTSLPPIIRNP